MPSFHYSAYGDDDLAQLIAYLKQIPAVEDKFRKRDIQFPGSIIFGILAYDSRANLWTPAVRERYVSMHHRWSECVNSRIRK